MAVHGSKAKIYVNGYNLSSVLRTANINRNGETVDVTCFETAAGAQTTDKEYIGGLKDGTISSEGFFDPSTGLSDAVLSAILNTDPSIWCMPVQGDTLGLPAYCANVIETRYNCPFAVNDAGKVMTEGQCKPIERTIILHPKGAQSSNGNGASVDNGASSANGGVGYCEGFEAGAQALTPKIQHSVDNSVWVDLITFTAIPGAGRTYERITVSGTVNRYTRANWATTGASAPFFAAFGRY